MSEKIINRVCETLFAAFVAGFCYFGMVAPAPAQTTCNPNGSPTGAWIQSSGTYTIGDIVTFGPGCSQVQDGGPINSGTFQKVTSGPFTFTTAQCNVEVIFEGNTYFAASIGSAASFGSCNLRLRNGDIYTGPGSGRGRLLTINGFGSFILYPGQYLNLQSDGLNWLPSCPLKNDGLGCPWFATASVQFFDDNGGSDTNNDGLAAGASGAFRNMAHCALVAYNVVYTKNLGSILCSQTAAQAFTEFLQVFYPLNGGGTLTFNSATPGSKFSWVCPVNTYCLQFGDNALVGVTDAQYVTNPSSIAIFLGHNYGVLDVNTNVAFNMNGGQSIFTCDFDTHFNINNGFNYQNSFSFLFVGCQGSSWNFNGAINTSAAATLSRLFNLPTSSKATFNGNVTWGTTGLTTSAGLVSGNSVLNNFSGTLPGGAPTPTTGGQYCTSLC